MKHIVFFANTGKGDTFQTLYISHTPEEGNASNHPVASFEQLKALIESDPVILDIVFRGMPEVIPFADLTEAHWNNYVRIETIHRQPVGKIALPEEVTPCCQAPFYAKTIYLDADGRVAQNGTPKQVRGCMCCGKNYRLPGEEFVIDSESSANWLLRKLANIRAEQDRIKANSDARIAELEADYNRLYGKYDQQLEMFALAEAKARRRKTVTLEQGVLSFRTVPAKLVIEDLQTAQDTARLVCPHAFATETIEKFDKAKYLAHAQATLDETTTTGEDGTAQPGVILPGVTLTEAREAFSVKFGD